MPNIKSAIKRVRVNDKKQEQNRQEKSKLATAIKTFKKAVESKNFEGIDALYSSTVSVIDNACSKEIIKKNTASRNKARLATLLAKAKKSQE